MEMTQIPAWEGWDWLRHGFSTRPGGGSEVYGAGALNLGFTREDDRRIVGGNREMFAAAVGGGRSMKLVTVSQVHGSRIVTVGADETGIVEADGLITDVPGVLLGVLVADCVPVLVADTRRRVVSAFHAGWRGTLAGIVELGIARMVEELGARTEDMVAAVGPSIGRCCYRVGEELRGEFMERFAYAEELFEERENGLYLGLAEANRRQMIEVGLAAERVMVVGECTACARAGGGRKYFSHRAEQGRAGRGMGAIGIAGED